MASAHRTAARAAGRGSGGSYARGDGRDASGRASSRGAGRAASGRRSGAEDRTIFGVPERFMRPRIVFIAVTAILVGFGLLMVYSSSSVTALLEDGDAASYFKKQLVLALVGLGLAVVIARADYHLWCRRLITVIWVVSVVLLFLVFTPFAGVDALGANRWIGVAGFQVQPSEFAKITVVLTAANLAERYFEEGSIGWGEFVKLLVMGVGVPIVLILLQPDKGTTMVLGVTIVLMAYLAGVPWQLDLALLGLGVAAFLVLSLADDYSRQRLLTMLDPWQDQYGAGYQLIQGFYAFGSGGLFGVGIGFSRQKYSYLPYAYNDFIFAVIGEECGLVGTLGVLVGFGIFAWAGLKIAQHAPDLAGRLIAAGCTSLIVVQMLLNVAGVVGVFPLSGKPIPFISYGGTSILASLMTAGMIVSVSVHSRLPETAHDSARRSWQMEGEPERLAGGGLSFVGEPVPRSARGASGSPGAGARGPSGYGTAGERAASGDRGADGPPGRGEPASGRGFTVVSGGARAPGGRSGSRSGTRSGGSRSAGSARPGTRGDARGGRSSRDGGARGGRTTTGADGRRRIDLGPSATERLRGGDDRHRR